MRKLFYSMAVVTACFFVFSLVRFCQQLSHTDDLYIKLGTLKGFDAESTDKNYEELSSKFRQNIKTHSDSAEKNQSTYFWMSFIVTVLTAASTLTSSIQAAKSDSDPKRAQKFAFIVAILTFLSTLANFGSTHFNQRKTEETKKATDLATTRNQFFADYSKAKAEDKTTVIKDYANRVD